jgi:amidase
MSETWELDAVGQAELVRSGEASAAELVDDAIARIEKFNPQLNAVIHERFEKARAEAAGALPDGDFKGVPYLLKDLDAHSAGEPFHEGMEFLKELGWKEDVDSYIVEKFRAAGMIRLGKTNTPELGLTPTTEPKAYGPTHNPWNTDHSSGGSSGGSAAAVASRMVAVAHAADGGGSIRIPASECGLVGLKPSRGRVSFGPTMHQPWHGFVVQHVVSRTVRDTAWLLDVTSGAMPGDFDIAPPPLEPFRDQAGKDPGKLRIGLMTKAPGGLATVHADCIAAAERAARSLGELGHEVEEAHPAQFDEDNITEPFITIVCSWTAQTLDALSTKTGKTITQEDVEPLTWAYADMGRNFTGPQYIAAITAVQDQIRRAALWWEDYDLLLTPTLSEPPPLLGEFDGGRENPFHGMARSVPVVVFAAPFNASGQPAISLPLHQSDAGLPIGVQLVSAYGREDRLLQVAAQLEEAVPWKDRRPPIS